MHGRIAEVERDGIVAMLGLDRDDARSDLVDGFIPADALPAAGRALHRVTQAIRVLVDILEAERLGADMAAAEWIVRVAADRQNLVAAQADLDAADRLAQVAGAVMAPDAGLAVHRSIRMLAVRSLPQGCAESGVLS